MIDKFLQIDFIVEEKKEEIKLVGEIVIFDEKLVVVGEVVFEFLESVYEVEILLSRFVV